MMQASSPIDCDIRRPFVDSFRGSDTSTSTDCAEFKDTFERGTVFAREAARAVPCKLLGGFGEDLFEQVDVFVGVKTRKLGFGCADGTLR